MKTVHPITVAILAGVVSLPAFSNPYAQTQSSGVSNEDRSMPMYERMMPMMRGRPGLPMVHDEQSDMPMLRSRKGRMPMMHGRQGGMHMMHHRHDEMQAHRKKMENYLANIEALLRELVELQKRK